MLLLYSLIYTLAFILMLPVMFLKRSKYSAGFSQRFGNIEAMDDEDDRIIWVHCVSVGETNAARPLIEKLFEAFPDYRVVISTTTATGQELAKKLFGSRASEIFYFPFDWRFTARRALKRIDPKIILIFETEIWFNFFREAHKRGTRICIVNGRLSEKSVGRYALIRATMKRVLHYVDLALMQDSQDAKRLIQLGIRSSKVKVTGNIKFDQRTENSPLATTAAFRQRFGIRDEIPLIIAASTHEPEEALILDALKRVWKNSSNALPRLVIAPRHPERFDEVEKIIRSTGFEWVRRSQPPSDPDLAAEVILLDSIGELRDIYPLAEIVFVGGSLIPRGGQSILEPAHSKTAIISGPHMYNFAAVVEEFRQNDAFIQLPEVDRKDIAVQLAGVLGNLLEDTKRRKQLAENAFQTANRNRGAVEKTIAELKPYLD